MAPLTQFSRTAAPRWRIVLLIEAPQRLQDFRYRDGMRRSRELA
jgi:hypothetical protein